MTPAELVISRFRARGYTPADIARGLDVRPSTVHRWTRPRSDGGTDGTIPHRSQPALLALARAWRVKLSAADLIEGSKNG